MRFQIQGGAAGTLGLPTPVGSMYVWDIYLLTIQINYSCRYKYTSSMDPKVVTFFFHSHSFPKILLSDTNSKSHWKSIIRIDDAFPFGVKGSYFHRFFLPLSFRVPDINGFSQHGMDVTTFLDFQCRAAWYFWSSFFLYFSRHLASEIWKKTKGFNAKNHWLNWIPNDSFETDDRLFGKTSDWDFWGFPKILDVGTIIVKLSTPTLVIKSGGGIWYTIVYPLKKKWPMKF